MVFPTFAAWAATFGKVYNGDEASTREAIYHANVVKIQTHNELGSSWAMDVNEFADLTEDEFLKQYTGAMPPSDSDEPIFEVEIDEDVADAVDWVQKGMVNQIKNQGQCGSCWAFSTMGTLESGYAIASGKLVSVAEQQLVDCDKSDSGCSGGWPHTAYDSYLAGRGVCS
jgi:cathepsin L